MVLISVDFPKPVWPDPFVTTGSAMLDVLREEAANRRTNNDHVELETTLQEFMLDLSSDTVETNV